MAGAAAEGAAGVELGQAGEGEDTGAGTWVRAGVQAVEGTGARTEVAGVVSEESMVVFVEKAGGTGK